MTATVQGVTTTPEGTMTKKHFVTAARLVQRELARSPSASLHPSGPGYILAKAFVELFESEPSRFNRDRFLRACGLD